MSIKAIDYNEALKNLLFSLREYTGLPKTHILNAYSVRGADLQKVINECQLISFDLKDSFIIFEFKEDDSKEFFVVPEEKEGYNNVISYYRMDLKIYGSSCHMLSKKILSIFREEKTILDLYSQGIYFKGVSNPTANNEFINNTLWPRTDMTINIEINTNIDFFKPIEYMDENSLNSKMIIKQK